MEPWPGIFSRFIDNFRNYKQPECITKYDNFQKEIKRQITALSDPKIRCTNCQIIRQDIINKNDQLKDCYAYYLLRIKLIDDVEIKDFMGKSLPSSNCSYNGASYVKNPPGLKRKATKACSGGQSVEKMSEYCRKSKRYDKIISLLSSQSAKLTHVYDIENREDIVIPAHTSFLNDILQEHPVRNGVVSFSTLGTIIMFFMHNKSTPLGSWLHNVMRGKKQMKHGIHREYHKSSNYSQEHMTQIFQRKRIKIAYQIS